MRGIVIAGTHSGCGKTTVTLALLGALARKGYQVQSFKAGPDFIDPGIHRLITGRPSRNLDLWMCGEQKVKEIFRKHSYGVHISVVEGVMGMYDGRYNTAMVADTLSLPLILVVDAYGMGESAGAVVHGFREYWKHVTDRADPLPLIGVLFNRVGSRHHYERIRESVKEVPVLGFLPSGKEFIIPERHLGLMVAEEHPITEKTLGVLSDLFLETVDVDLLVASAERYSASKRVSENNDLPVRKPLYINTGRKRVRVALAYDRAFSFYYEDNLDIIRETGAEIVSFSPLSDTQLPEGVEMVYLGGGYPELYAESLAENVSMLESLRKWSFHNGAMYAECGGLIYLSKGMLTLEGKYHDLVGIFPFEMVMKKKRACLGYREVVVQEDILFCQAGDVLRGHEFHYSEIKGGVDSSILKQAGVTCVYSVSDRNRNPVKAEGYRRFNTLASYIHLHFFSNDSMGERFSSFFKNLRLRG